MLQQLLAHKPGKGGQLLGYLQQFAQQQGFSPLSFTQWQHVMFAKDHRHLAAHSSKLKAEDLSYLENLITDPSSSVAEYKDAVNALVATARKMGLK
jgi:hypothetical protein